MLARPLRHTTLDSDTHHDNNFSNIDNNDKLSRMKSDSVDFNLANKQSISNRIP